MISYSNLNRIVSIFILSLFTILNAQERIAILQFEGSGVNFITAKNITNRFSYELSKTNRFDIVEREMMDKILQEQKFQKSGCVSEECAVEIGQMIGVRQIVAGSVDKIEDFYSLNIRLIDVESGKIIYQDMDDYEGKVSIFIRVTVKNMAMRMAAEASKGMAREEDAATQFTSTKTGRIIFNINQNNVAIFIDGQYNSRSIGNQVILSIVEGIHTIKFSQSNFNDWEKEIYVLADEQLIYDVVLEPGKQSAVVADTGILLVRSDPTEAVVFIDGIEKGKTLLQVIDIGVGSHEVRVEKNLYHNYTEIVNIQPDMISEVQAELKQNFGNLSIKSFPTGSVVMINGQVKGKTPYYIGQIKSGSYNIQVSKDLYHNYEENFIITDGSSNTRDIRLTPSFGQLVIKTNPPGVDVKLDGQSRGVTPFELDELPSGNYHLTLTKDLYQTLDQGIVIEDGKTLNLNEKLEARSGLISIIGKPIGAEITANRKKIGNIPLKGYRISEGMVELKVNAKDYYEESKFMNIKRDQSYKETFNLEKHTGKLIVITDPPNADVLLDKKVKGKTPSILNGIPVGKHTIEVEHPDYLSQSETFNLSLNEKKKIQFKLITYSGSIQQKIDKTKSKYTRYFAGAAFMAAVGAGAYFQANKNYESYKRATSSSDATNLYNRSKYMDYGSAGSLVVASGLGLTTLKYYNDYWRLKYKLRSVNKNSKSLVTSEEHIAPPHLTEGSSVKFIPYDDPPRPLMPIRPKYPEIAQEAGIEGTVIVQAFVDKKGRVKETSILKGIPNTGLDEAAITAICKTRFVPAKQRERAVGVWISIPVHFRLK